MQKIEILQEDFPLKLNHQELIQDLATAWNVPIDSISITKTSEGKLIVETKNGITETIVPAKIIIEANTDKPLPDAQILVKAHSPQKSTEEQALIDETTKKDLAISELPIIENILQRLTALEAK